ncbi:MAG: MBL fold metallo-hydrolase [Actinomycetota bacterium]|nr:MBL fold metallo-hydrolase [Actinomycetota bacterium]
MAHVPSRAPELAPSRRRFIVAPPRAVADGVWLIRGGLPRRTINVFLIDSPDGVIAFDAGIRGMGGAIAALATPLGGIARVVISHAHPDHRGGARALGAPILCHAAERADVEGSGGKRYFTYHETETPIDRIRKSLAMRLADRGPVQVAGTLLDGDQIAGFTVIHLPGHAPGLIALWRPGDHLALASDAFTTQATSPPGAPGLPKPVYSQSPDQARNSLLKLAALDPVTAWPGHGDPLTGDVRHALERAARA